MNKVVVFRALLAQAASAGLRQSPGSSSFCLPQDTLGQFEEDSVKIDHPPVARNLSRKGVRLNVSVAYALSHH